MRKKNYKGRCEKEKLEKCVGVCRTYDQIQNSYAIILSRNNSIKEFRCNVPLDSLEYTSDFVCTKNDGSIMVRECVKREHISKPLTAKLLDMSRNYWLNRGITDWGLVTNEEK